MRRLFIPLILAGALAGALGACTGGGSDILAFNDEGRSAPVWE